LLRECGVLNALSEAAQTTLTNLITLLLGLTISFSMQADAFVTKDTILVLCIGLLAFIFDTIGGVLLAKVLNLFRKEKINPMIGAAGISAFPMASRVVQKMADEEEHGNVILMHAAGANVSGQIASVIAGGLVIQIVASYL
ncbi:MAG: sodium ion-translocating decarboxylase subunit beta, partial [Lachnospiraceae bacterium]|nr:sodium ion-translocating decarboxylase subunit beta [Lachnospiraceae bacterium]